MCDRGINRPRTKYVCIGKERNSTWTEPRYGEVIGCASFKIGDRKGNIDVGKTWLYRVLISKAAYQVWTLRCARAMGHEDNPSKWPHQRHILSQLRYKLNLRLRMDCLHTNERRFSGKAIRESIVKRTWC